MSTNPTVGLEKKVSVYIALGIGGAVAITDLIINNSVAASQNVVMAFLAFAGGRQVLKSTINK